MSNVIGQSLTSLNLNPFESALSVNLFSLLISSLAFLIIENKRLSSSLLIGICIYGSISVSQGFCGNVTPVNFSKPSSVTPLHFDFDTIIINLSARTDRDSVLGKI